MVPDLRLAHPGEIETIRGLIVSEGLPAIDIEDQIGGFWVLDDGGALVGCAGIELYGEAAVLRSVMVAPSLRGTREGERLIRRALTFAREGGAKRCYLFTMTAMDYFPRFGFERCTLDDFEPAAREGWQWRGISESPELASILIPMRATL